MIDSTSLRVFIQRHRSKLIPLISALVIFASGWQLGRVTSPYYASTPIVFQDRVCEDCASSGGDTQELKTLQEEGIKEVKAAVEASALPSTAPARVQAATTTAATVPAAGTTQGQFVASKNSNLYHHYTCPSVKQIKVSNQRWFATAAAAKAAGLTPSKCTIQKVGN